MSENKITVLHVDDDPADTEMLRDALRRADRRVEVIAFEDPTEALFAFKSGLRTDLVVLDINMPKLNGIELIEAFLSSGYSVTPIVVLSTSRNEKIEKEAAKLGTRGFFVKPFNLADYDEICRQMLALCR